MLEHVLRETGTVFELTQQADDIGVDAVHARVESGLFAHFPYLNFQLLFALVHNVFDAGRMDAAVLDEAFQGHASHLTADGTVRG